MRGLLVLLLCAASYADDASLLGPYHRPGVPVLRPRDGGGTRLDGALRPGLEPVPAGVLLVGVAGGHPDDLAERLTAQAGAEVRVVPIPDGADVAAVQWPALDVFDRVYLVHRPAAPMHVRWVQAGGDLVLVGSTWTGPRGLGRVHAAADLDASLAGAPPVAPPAIPRPSPVNPDVYHLVSAPEGPSGALTTARWVVLGTLAALAVQVLLAAAGVLRARVVVLVTAGVVLAGAVVGRVRTEADYRPLATGRIEVAYIKGDVERRRTYYVYTRVGPGPVVLIHNRPILYRAGGPEWTDDVPEDVIRIYLEERVVEAGRTLGSEAGFLGVLLRRAAPAGDGWQAFGSREAAPPEARPGPATLIARLELVRQD